jgi:hypothetical protein
VFGRGGCGGHGGSEAAHSCAILQLGRTLAS